MYREAVPRKARESPTHEWWNVLPPVQQEQVRARSQRLEFARHETIGRADGAEAVCFLEKGLVRLYRRSAQGAEVTLGFVRAGEVFGELPYLVGATRGEYAVAFCASTIWRTPYDVVSAIVTEHPQLLLVIAQQIAARLRRIEDRITDLAFRRTRGRFAAALLDLARDFGRTEAGVVTLELSLSQDELATLIGATRQTVNLEVKALVEDGVLRVERRRLQLLDVSALRALSEAER
jgi:CRP/FNR family cyclic AMP-dependent transcriptional regulator